MPIKIFIALVASLFKALSIKTNFASKDFDVKKTAKGVAYILTILLIAFLVKRIAVLSHRVHDIQHQAKILETECHPVSPVKDPTRSIP